MIEIAEIMTGLARVRPIFHSEADFQHALAWHIHQTAPSCGVRLEYRPFPEKSMYLDLWLAEMGVALELKYVTSELHHELDGETFRLKNQSAQDTRRYDFLIDVQRLEQVAHLPQARRGFAVLLTNDASYWKPPGRKAVNDSEFRLHDGRQIIGEMDWAENTGSGTKKGRESRIVLEGSYELRWQEYSGIGQIPNARFRYVLVEVPA